MHSYPTCSINFPTLTPHSSQRQLSGTPHSSLPTPRRGYRQALLFDLLELLCDLAMRHAGAMQPQEVSGVLWAVACLDFPLEDELMEVLIQVQSRRGLELIRI